MSDDYYKLASQALDEAEHDLETVRSVLSDLSRDLKELNWAFAKLLEEDE